MTPQKFWMVWLHDSPTTEKRHPHPDLAWEEARRIVREPENLGRKVYVLEALGYKYVEDPPVSTMVF